MLRPRVSLLASTTTNGTSKGSVRHRSASDHAIRNYLLFDCLTARGDELFDLADALLCADGPVTTPVDLTLVAEHRRGHGAMYDALNSGNVDAPRLRQVLAGLPMPQAADGRLSSPST
ncbi:hypothetical protein GCM10010270_06660 [Streptomyces violaceus]|nr:hypothetical protein GCM10010270_06660 [Streptomyces janthinus]